MAYKRFSLLAIILILASFLSSFLLGCGGGSPSAVVSVKASVTSVDGANAITLTATVTNDKGTSGVTWSVSGGGTLSNMTTTSVTFIAPAATTSAQTVIISATSVADSTKTGSLTLTIPAKPAITAPSGTQLTGSVGAAYSLQLASTGGIAPYTWTLSGGTLPTGWSLTAGGLLSGPAPVAAQAGAINLTFTVTDSGTPTALSATLQLTVTITAAPAIMFTGTVPTTATSGTAYSGSAAASGGAGALTYSLNSGALPSGLSLNASTGAITGSPTTVGPSSFTVRAADSFGDAPATQNYSITVSPGAATHYAVSGPATATAGTALTFTVTAYDINNNIATGYSGTVHFTSTDGSATLPANAGLTSGQGSFQGTLKTAGNQTIAATDTVTSTITGGTAAIAVAPGAATHLLVSAPATATAGSPLNVSVTAHDAYNNTATSYSGTVHLTSTDGAAVLATDSCLSNGTATFPVTLKTAASETVTATDTATSSITGTTGPILVSAAPATNLVVTGPATATAGTAINIGVTAMDAYNNIAKSYSGTVHFTSADGAATLPANSTLTNGQGTFAATLKTAGSGTVTATDTVTASIAGTTSAIVVSPGAVSRFSSSAPTTAIAGTPFNMTVTAKDAYGNVVTSYSGTVHFASDDQSAVLPADSTLTNGTNVFPATLKTSGDHFISANDTNNSSIGNAASFITVNPGATTHLVVTAPATATAGIILNVSVTAMDAYNNVATGYAGTVHFSSSDPAAVLAANSGLLSGQQLFSAKLTFAGSQTITATDTTDSSITGSTSAITVNPGATTHFALSAPAGVIAGTPITVTMTALDAYNNTATGYAGTVHFTSTDSQGVLPGDMALGNGQGTIQATLKTAANQTVIATDTVTSSITGSTSQIAVAAGATTHLIVSTPSTAVAGTGFSLTVTGKDAYNNTDTSYQGTLLFTTSDPYTLSGVLVTTSGWNGGVRGYTATLRSAGSQTISVTDTGHSSISGITPAITVDAGPATRFTVWYSASNPTAGTPYNIGLIAYDSYGNAATNYSGTVHFTSTDSAAAMPPDTALTNGQGSFPATMKTVGSHSITASDSVNGSINGTSSQFQVVPGATAHLVFTAVPPSPAAVGPQAVTVESTDTYGNVTPGYGGIVHITSTDQAAVLPSDSTIGAMHSFQVTLETAGSQTITATDTVNQSITATTSSITVVPGATTHFSVTAPSTAASAVAISVTVAAKDTYNNTVTDPTTGYLGTVHITSTDGSAVLPANSTLTNGQGTFQTILNTSGSQTITATDTVSPAITGTSNSIAVSNIIISPSSATLTPAFTGSPYSQTFTASGGTAPYAWSMTVNGTAITNLGLNLDPNTGTLSGNVPSGAAVGPINFTVAVTDHSNATVSKQFSLNVYNPLTFTPNLPNPAVYNSNYSGAIVAMGGSGSYTWTVNNGPIPTTGVATAMTGGSGLTGTNNGDNMLAIDGIPNAYGTITLVVKVTDTATGLSKSQTFAISVNSLSVSVDPNNVPQGMVGMPYTFGSINIQNGTSPYTINYTNAPAGLADNANNSLVGSPASSGTTIVTVKVTDSSMPTHQVGTTTFSLPVVPITIGTDNGKLNGQYACYLDLYWNGGVTGGNGTSMLYRGGMLFAFTTNGSGAITDGEVDNNSPYSGYNHSSSIAGGYAIGSDNRGYINIGSGSLIMSVAGANLSSNVFQELALTVMDDAGTSPGGQSGAGHCYKQVTTALNGIRPTGSFVVGLHGESMEGATVAGLAQVVYNGSAATGIQDFVAGTGAPFYDTFSNTITTADSYGRIIMLNSGVNESVSYLTNDSKGDAFTMTIPGHNGSNNADFFIGQVRAQNLTNIAANYPINGNAVMYLSGPVSKSGSSPTYKAMATQLTGSASANQIKINSIVNNSNGSFSLDTDSVYGQTINYTTDPSTGRTTLTGASGDYLYLYDTNSAVVLFGDSKSGGGTQNLIGWLEPQTTSGSWSVSDIATSVMMYKEPNGNYNSDWNDGVLSAASDGTISGFASDDGGRYWASWDEPLSGSPLVLATGALALNATDGANFGLLDISMTSGGLTSKEVECYAISVDAAVKPTTRGRLVCVGTSSDGGSLSILQE